MSPETIARPRPEVVSRGGVPEVRPGWVERATSADHKQVGLLYIATALSFLAFAALEFAFIRLQLIVPENTILDPQIFNQLISIAPVSLVVLALIPLALGLIGYIVPLQIGARGVALPRLNQLSYWLYLAGSVTVYASFLYAPPDTGTAALAPLSDTVFSPSNGPDAWIAGTALAVTGFVCFAINLIATLNRLRAPGVAWRRLTPFAWAARVIAYLLVVVGPVMVAALVMLEIDRRFDGVFFDPGDGGAPLLYQHFSSIFFTGSYLIVFLLAAGAISEILPTFARKPIFSHRAVAGSFVAIGALGPFAWMQSMYEAPLNEGWTIMAMGFALALAVPIGTLIFTWVATLWGGALELRAASLYALVAISTMVSGLAGELAYSVIPVGWMLDNTTASQGDTLYVLVGGGVIGGFAALHYWFPKLSGRLLGEGLGKVALALIFFGINLYVIPMFFAGLNGQAVDVFEYFDDSGVDGYNLIASIGAFILVIGILVELANAAYSWSNGLSARGHDPWGGSTLEWYALSPPPAHNFDAVPDVRSAEPLYDIRESVRRNAESFVAPPALEPVESPGREPDPDPDDRNRLCSLTRMTDVADRGDAGDLARFRRLVSWTIAATLVLILVGGVVRVSDSGLGCGPAGSGTQGWPLCEGGVIPEANAESVIEFSHRIAAGGRRRADRGDGLAGDPQAAPAPRAGSRIGRRGSARPRPGRPRRTDGRERPRGGAGSRASRLGDALDRAAGRASPRGLARPRGRACGPRAGAARADRRRGGAGAGDDRRRRLRRRHREARARPTRPAAARPTSPAARLRRRRFPGCNGQFLAASARRASPTSSSPTACSCTWRRSRCSRWWRWRSVGGSASRAFALAAPLLVARSCSARSTSGSASTPGLIVGHLALGTVLWAPSSSRRDPAARLAPAAERIAGREADPGGGCLTDGERDHDPTPGRTGQLEPAGAPAAARRAAPRERSLAAMVRDYLALTKPRIISLLLLTTVATMFVADPSGPALSTDPLDDARRLPGRGRRRRDQPLPRPRPRRADGADPRPAAGRRADRAARTASSSGSCSGRSRRCSSR